MVDGLHALLAHPTKYEHDAQYNKNICWRSILNFVSKMKQQIMTSVILLATLSNFNVTLTSCNKNQNGNAPSRIVTVNCAI